MKIQRAILATGTAMVLGAATAWSQYNGATTQATATTDPNSTVVVRANGATVAVSASTNRGAASVAASRGAVGIDPATGLPAAGSPDEIMRQVNEEMRRAMENIGDGGQVREAVERAMRQMQNAISGTGGVGFAASGPAAAWSGGYARSGPLGGSQSEPAVVTTSTMAPGKRGEWKEDLKVMDRLLRDGLNRVEGDTSRQALGIRLVFSGAESQPPMYLDGYGALFSYTTDITLAPTGKKPEKKEEKSASSTWDNARRQLNPITYSDGQEWARMYRSGSWMPSGPAAEFDAARLEALTDAVVKTLLEASNIRHLQDDECVTVTITGRDEAGEPARLTLKAMQRDVVKLANGKLTPEEFKQKVARSIG